jgi:hypothetical protein
MAAILGMAGRTMEMTDSNAPSINFGALKESGPTHKIYLHKRSIVQIRTSNENN